MFGIEPSNLSLPRVWVYQLPLGLDGLASLLKVSIIIQINLERQKTKSKHVKTGRGRSRKAARGVNHLKRLKRKMVVALCC